MPQNYDPQKYDPAARRARYLRDRQLKGRQKGSQPPPKGRGTGRAATTAKSGRPPPRSKPSARPTTTDTPQQATARVARLKSKIATLEGALTKALAALAEKRRSAAKSEKESSDNKTTAKERQDSKEYREKHKQELAAKRKSKDEKSSSKSGGSSSSASSRDASTMSVDELEARVSKLKSAIKSAKAQLSAATKASGQLSHSDTSAIELRLSAPISRKESVQMTADFGGYVTRHGVPCADGRTILPGAFKGNDGQIVPLVYQHGHNNLENVLGHVKLEYRDDGVYGHGYFNETAAGQNAKIQVKHGDLKFLSIFANQLSEKARAGLQHAKDVLRGNIREVSLVLAGANPGAFIDNVMIAHGDGQFDMDESEAVITTGMEIELEEKEVVSHAAPADTDDDETLQDVIDSMSEKQRDVLYYMVGQAIESNEVEHDDLDESVDEVDEEDEAEDGVDDDTDDTDTGNDSEAGDDVQHDNSQEDNSMTHNVFDQAKTAQDVHPQVTLSHSDVEGIVSSAMKGGSLKTAVEEYALQHGIENLDYLFPDAKTLESSPAFISRRMEWVDTVLNGVRKSPFSRIKTITADITPDEARARGYIKGNMKNEEFFALSKRETTPQTIYKKQKLDRDDVVDITTLDVVAWLKAEMKVMLDEELAGAILVGDGRSIGDDDKIKETNIRPIASDAELYVTTVHVNLDDADSTVEELVDRAIANRRFYKGSGQPDFFTTEATISAFLTVRDNFGRRIYANLQEVAAVLRVRQVVPVEVMERVDDLIGIMVNLADYTLGADRGGQATMFDDFDIDYNKLRYLIETRCSGALTTPKAALVFRRTAASDVERTPEEPTFDGTTVTVPTVSGVTYRNADTNAVLTTAAPVTLGSGQTLRVRATADSGGYFATNAEDEWTYTNRA